MFFSFKFVRKLWEYPSEYKANRFRQVKLFIAFIEYLLAIRFYWSSDISFYKALMMKVQLECMMTLELWNFFAIVNKENIYNQLLKVGHQFLLFSSFRLYFLIPLENVMSARVQCIQCRSICLSYGKFMRWPIFYEKSSKNILIIYSVNLFNITVGIGKCMINHNTNISLERDWIRNRNKALCNMEFSILFQRKYSFSKQSTEVTHGHDPQWHFVLLPWQCGKCFFP